VNLVNNGQNTSITGTTPSTPVLLDTGSTLSYLPTAIADKLYSALGVTWSNQDQAAYCPCSLANSSATVDFSFSGQSIPVQMNELVLPGGLTRNEQQEGCTFGIFQQDPTSGGGSSYTLGDTFIRSAYIVYDLGNNQISLAPTDFEATSSNVMEIGTGAQAVPNASGVASAAQVSASGTAVKGGIAGGLPTGTAATATSSGAAAPTGHANNMAWAGLAGAAGLLFAL